MLKNDVPPVLPLWINGHAFLTLTPAFQDVTGPHGSEVLRRTPLCGADEVRMAVVAAQAALACWAGMSETARISLLSAVGDALASYAGHFARLISEENGNESFPSVTEVSDAVALLRSAMAGKEAGVVAVIGNREAPLLGPLRLAVSALAAGSVVVIRPCAKTPSALFALAELTGRCGFPDGVFNIVYGGETVVDSLRASRDVSLLLS